MYKKNPINSSIILVVQLCLFLGLLTHGNAVTLKYDLKPGDMMKYKVTVSEKGSLGGRIGSMPGPEDMMPTSIQTEVTYEQRVISVSPEGIITIGISTSAGTIKTTIGGMGGVKETFPTNRPTITIKMTNYGRLLSIIGLDKLQLAGMQGIACFDFTPLYNQLMGIGGFPQIDVKVGDSWKHEFMVDEKVKKAITKTKINDKQWSMSTSWQGPNFESIKSTTKVEGFELIRGHKCIKLKTVIDIPLNKVISSIFKQLFSGNVVAKGTQRIEMVSFFAYEEGKLIESEGKYSTKSAMTAPMSQPQAISPQTMTTVVDTNGFITILLLPESK